MVDIGIFASSLFSLSVNSLAVALVKSTTVIVFGVLSLGFCVFLLIALLGYSFACVYHEYISYILLCTLLTLSDFLMSVTYLDVYVLSPS